MKQEHETLLRSLADGNYHHGGLKILKSCTLPRAEAQTLEDAADAIVAENTPSVVKAGAHVTGWTQPFGQVDQYSCWNTHGDTSNTNEDFSYQPAGRSFVHPALAAFFKDFPGLANLRLNVMYPDSGLSPHEEHLVLNHPDGGVRMRTRFHIPVRTNAGSSVFVDGEWYKMKRGSMFLFNNGTVHSARNRGKSKRLHFVFDVMLTEAACDFICEMHNETSQGMIPMQRERVEEFVPSGGVDEATFNAGPLRYW